ncbi:MAG TPA: hypothetical protein VKJ01_24980 [Candidatus Solibacter sp.]|nr:hypothetical protein [Candidatus Solibacter sp.]
MTKTTFTNMNRRAACATLSMLVLSAMSLAVPAASAKDGNDGHDGERSRSRTTLAGPAIAGQTPNGHADTRVDSSRGRSRVNVEVEDVNLAAGTMLTVVVIHGDSRTMVGTITLDAFHSGELELNSQDGDTVPAVQQGDIVIVMNADVAILTGVF